MKRIIFTLVTMISALVGFLISMRIGFGIGESIFLGVIIGIGSLFITGSILEYARRNREGEPLWQPTEPGPRKLPLWYRILSKIFR